MKSFLRAILVVYFLFACILLANKPKNVSVGVFQQEQRIFYNVDHGLHYKKFAVPVEKHQLKRFLVCWLIVCKRIKSKLQVWLLEMTSLAYNSY